MLKWKVFIHRDIKSSRGMPSFWFFGYLVNKLMQTYLVLISWAEPSEASQTWEGKTEGLWEALGCQVWLSPEVRCTGVPRATTATLGQKRPTLSCSPPAAVYIPLLLLPAHPPNQDNPPPLFSSLFCVKFIGLWFLHMKDLYLPAFFPIRAWSFLSYSKYRKRRKTFLTSSGFRPSADSPSHGEV